MKTKLFIYFIFALGFAKAQTIAGPLSAATISNNAATGVSWTITPTPSAFMMLSPYTVSKGIVSTNFGFTIPGNATITGVEAVLNYSYTVLSDTIVRLVLNNIETGTNKATNTVLACCSRTYGASNDLWGTGTLSPTDINSPNFGFVVYLKDTYYTINNNVYILNSGPGSPFQIKVYYSTLTGVIQSQTSGSGYYVYSHNKKLFVRNRKRDTIRIYNLYSMLVKEYEVDDNSNEFALDDLPNGIYYYKFDSEENIGKIYMD